jgi:hypothetical protein
MVGDIIEIGREASGGCSRNLSPGSSASEINTRRKRSQGSSAAQPPLERFN